MTAKEVMMGLLAKTIKPQHYRGSDNIALLDMLKKMKEHYQTLKQDLEVIRDEIRTVILANEPGGNYPEIEAIEWDNDIDDITGIPIAADSPYSIESSDCSDISDLICDLDESDKEMEPKVIDLADSSEDETVAQLGAKYRTLKEN